MHSVERVVRKKVAVGLMVEVYIWICDFGLLEIKQNGFKIFRGQAPLSRYIEKMVVSSKT